MITEIKYIKETKKVNAMILLQDKRIAVASDNKTVNIFNPSDNYKCDLSVTEEDNVYNICQIMNGNIITSGGNDTNYIHIYTEDSLKEKKAKYILKNKHNFYISFLISLSDGSFVSISNQDIFFWKVDEPFIDKPYKTLQERTEIFNILEMKGKNNCLVAIGANYDITRIFSLKTYQIEKVITGMKGSVIQQLDEERIVIGGTLQIFIANIVTTKIEKIIKGRDIGYCYSLLVINKDFFICNCSLKGKVILFDKTKDKYLSVQTSHKQSLRSMIKLDDGSIVSSGWNVNGIRVWSYQWKEEEKKNKKDTQLLQKKTKRSKK